MRWLAAWDVQPMWHCAHCAMQEEARQRKQLVEVETAVAAAGGGDAGAGVEKLLHSGAYFRVRRSSLLLHDGKTYYMLGAGTQELASRNCCTLAGTFGCADRMCCCMVARRVSCWGHACAALTSCLAVYKSTSQPGATLHAIKVSWPMKELWFMYR